MIWWVFIVMMVKNEWKGIVVIMNFNWLMWGSDIGRLFKLMMYLNSMNLVMRKCSSIYWCF